MQRDYSYSNARQINDLDSLEKVGERSAKRALMRLQPKPIKTGQYPVIFESRVATSLISSLVSFISGGNNIEKHLFA